jgi:hypothetical protein
MTARQIETRSPALQTVMRDDVMREWRQYLSHVSRITIHASLERRTVASYKQNRS